MNDTITFINADELDITTKSFEVYLSAIGGPTFVHAYDEQDALDAVVDYHEKLGHAYFLTNDEISALPVDDDGEFTCDIITAGNHGLFLNEPDHVRVIEIKR